MSGFVEIAIILVLATAIGLIVRAFGQPLIVGHVITGIVVAVSGLVLPGESIETLGHIGVALLLFLVGLHLHPRTIRETGKVSVITGIGQVIFTSGIGYLILRGLGFEVMESIYLATALTFSSTIIISKLLSDKGDLDTVYGRISIGFLIVQDIVVIIVLMLVGSGANTVLQDIILLVGLAIVVPIIMPVLTRYAAKNQELLLLFALAWSMAIAALFQTVGLSLEAGALVAGVALSASQYRHEISARLSPVRDFFILMFFIVLGMQMSISSIGVYLWPAILLSLFVLIGNPVIVLILMRMLGYPGRVSFHAGLTVAQISEFSLILIALGVSAGHLKSELLSLITLVGLITIGLSTYLIMHADAIYNFIERFVSRRFIIRDHRAISKYDFVLLGCNRAGMSMMKTLRGRKKMLAIDYDPERVRDLKEQQIPVIYGDAEDPEILEDIKGSRLVVSTIARLETDLLLLHTLKRPHNAPIVIVTAHRRADAQLLYDAGASYVVVPQHLTGKHIASLIRKCKYDRTRYSKYRRDHLKELLNER